MKKTFIIAVLTFIAGVISTFICGMFGLMLLDGEIELFTVTMFLIMIGNAVMSFVNAIAHFIRVVDESVFEF